MVLSKRNKIQVHVFRRDRESGRCLFLLLHKCVERGSYWQPITGNANPEESAEACARRELREEVGMESLKFLHELFSFEFEKKGQVFHETVYAAEAFGPEVTLSPEHDAYSWEPHEAARERIYYESNKEALDQVARKIAEGEL